MSVDDSKHREIRAAKFSIEQTPNEGVTLCVEAGELQLRFYIDGQWSDLLHELHTGEGELGEIVPFRMKPTPISALKNVEEGAEVEEATVISTSTIGAHPIPGLTQKDSVYDTPLWKNAFPSLRSESEEPESKE